MFSEDEDEPSEQEQGSVFAEEPPVSDVGLIPDTADDPVFPDDPPSPADSIPRSPAPIMRSKIDWLKNTVLIRSSGISIPVFEMTPRRETTRSLVTTKLVVFHTR